jgi:hypothetical protein
VKNRYLGCTIGICVASTLIGGLFGMYAGIVYDLNISEYIGGLLGLISGAVLGLSVALVYMRSMIRILNVSPSRSKYYTKAFISSLAAGFVCSTLLHLLLGGISLFWHVPSQNGILRWLVVIILVGISFGAIPGIILGLIARAWLWANRSRVISSGGDMNDSPNNPQDAGSCA